MEHQDKDSMNEDMHNEEDLDIKEKDSTTVFDTEPMDPKKKMQNVIALGVILAGLFAGSLFVDIVQLVTGSGFSQNALSKATVLSSGNKTWVAYEEPIVHVDVISDKTCPTCDPNQALVWLRRVMPTISAKQIDYGTSRGKAMAEKAGVISLPAFIFGEEVSKTDVFTQAESLFVKHDDNRYSLSTEQLGIPAGKLLALPEIKEGDIQVGPQDAKVKIIEYSDFQCPYCKLLHPAIQQVLKDYEGKVQFSYKQFPLSFHPMANPAALASECANEQGKFFKYSDYLFENQEKWSVETDTRIFKSYASLFGLNTTQFGQCLDSAKYQDKIDADTEEGKKFGVSGTPGTFVNDQFIGGAVSVDELKKTIDAELAK